jgi:hypothetical protein
MPHLLYSWERAVGTHQLQGWFDPKACLDIEAKKEVSFHLWDLKPGSFSL